MAKISLRAYLREIEGLIEHGQIDEAIAHCKHILQFYPKLIAAYRLLGKAYLEDQRYGDAADIFQRVLSSVPDDFVSHVGMSIIREDEGNLDAAIWHMERAYEVQPYNPAIQDELRRLFQRRDGIEPHKIRLTRGALARMYVKGDLYRQAIAELRAAQADEEQRPDLQTLLARTYYLSGMLVEAVEVCSVLLKKLPYCLEANRLLASILPQTERKDEARIYQQRIAALDPYLAAAPITSTSSEGIPENIATLEKLDYKPAPPGAEAPSQPAWAASLGISLEGFTPAEEPLPDWLAGDELQSPAASAQETARLGEEPVQELPATSRLPWEIPADTASDLPDWISSPPKISEETTGGKTPAVTGSLIPSWMKEAGWEPSSEDKQHPPSETVPLEEEQPAEDIARAEIPDWLKAIAPSDIEPSEQETGPTWEQEAETGRELELPAWLRSLEQEEEMAAESSAEEAKLTPLEEEVQAAEPIAWTEAPAPAELETPTPAPKLESETKQEPDLVDQESALAWLESLAARQGAAEEELITRPEERTTELPAWLQADIEAETAFTEASETQPPAAPPAAPRAEPVGEWLPEDTLITQPQAEAPELATEPTEELPQWLQAAGEEAMPEMASGEEPSSVEEVGISDWLKALDAQLSPEEEAAPRAMESVEAEISLKAAEEPEAAAPEAQSETGPSMIPADQESALAWLESLAARQGAAEEELITRPGERLTELPAWLQAATQTEAVAPEEKEEEAQPLAEELAAESQAIADTQPVKIVPAQAPEAPGEAIMGFEEAPPVSEIAYIEEEVPELFVSPAEAAPETGESAQVAEEVIAPSQEEPELPSWLAEVAAGQPEEEEYAWMPPEIAAEAALAEIETARRETAPLPETPGVTPPSAEHPTVRLERPAQETAPSEAAVRQINVNTASLIELETLPGMGFIQAQNILSYRDAHGPFSRLEDLLNVPGFNPLILDEIRGRLTTGIEEKEAAPASLEALEPEMVDPDQAVLIQARNALIQENIAETVARYSYLIKKERMLDTVIRDLYEALYHFPMDVSIWQTLGDAYVRNNQLQEALDAYIKAEELLR